MFIWFLINTLHYNQMERKNVEILVHLTLNEQKKAKYKRGRGSTGRVNAPWFFKRGKKEGTN